MKESYFREPVAHSEESIKQFRTIANNRIETLLRTRAPLDKLSTILGAEKFITVKKARSGASVIQFDIEGFVSDQIAKGTYLEIPTEYVETQEIILPPDPGKVLSGESEESARINRENIPRTKYAIEVLSEMKEPYSIVEGEVTSQMVRGKSYRMLIVPGLDKVLLVNDERSNPTFIIHQLSQVEGGWKAFTAKGKNELKKSAQVEVNFIMYLGDPASWKAKLKHLLTHGFIRQESRGILEKTSIQECERAPEGWKTPAALARELRVEYTTIASRFNLGIKNNPELFRRLKGTVHVYAHPDFTDMVASEILSREPAPGSWQVGSSLAERLNVSRHLISRIVAPYRELHPEWFRQHLDAVNKNAEYFHPELIAIIQQEIAKREKAPAGWVNKASLVRVSGVSFRMVARRIEKYRQTHPEWFHDYTAPATHEVIEQLHPDLADIILKEVSQYKDAPPGWVTNKNLAESLGVSERTVSAKVHKYRDGHPDWFLAYRGKKGRVFEHFHPDLIEIVSSEIKEFERAPEGWMPNGRLAHEIHRGTETIAKLVDEYRTDQPGWFHKYLNKSGNIVEHFHPGLIKIIRGRLEN